MQNWNDLPVGIISKIQKLLDDKEHGRSAFVSKSWELPIGLVENHPHFWNCNAFTYNAEMHY